MLHTRWDHGVASRQPGGIESGKNPLHLQDRNGGGSYVPSERTPQVPAPDAEPRRKCREVRGFWPVLGDEAERTGADENLLEEGNRTGISLTTITPGRASIP